MTRSAPAATRARTVGFAVVMVLATVAYLALSAYLVLAVGLGAMGAPCADVPVGTTPTCDWGWYRASSQLALWGSLLSLAGVLTLSIRAHRRRRRIAWWWVLGVLALVILYFAAFAVAAVGLGWRSPFG
ncbi:hypothetical protein [Microbacterium gorillae]|uniref:hypothetical protein n=1 Tax=Microbacterium gorillae TaxID=1231063 RepID=UPI0011430F0C|nr:hypothetical protein [Microbacterium gorillae]